MLIPTRSVGVALGIALLLGTAYVAADNIGRAGTTKVAQITSSRMGQNSSANRLSRSLTEAGAYTFGAPPNGSYAEQTATYRPIAELLTRVTGKHFIYRYSDNWLSYSRDMTGGAYDLVFDSAALNSWRIERIHHTPLLRLSGSTVYVVVTRAGDRKIDQLGQLAGYRVCAPPPPDMATLTLLSHFNNPSRQPVITETNGWNNAYRQLAMGGCDGAVMTRKYVEYMEKIDPGHVAVLYQSTPLPNPAFSAGPRISPKLQDLIRQALLSPQGRHATAKLRAAHGGAELIATRGEDYAGLDKLLKNSLYYY